MAKTNISMPDALLDEVDRRAQASNITRSGFIQEAAAHYIATLDAEAERTLRSERIERAVGEMADIGRNLPEGPSGTVILRQMRDAAPRWFAEDEGTDD